MSYDKDFSKTTDERTQQPLKPLASLESNGVERGGGGGGGGGKQEKLGRFVGVGRGKRGGWLMLFKRSSDSRRRFHPNSCVI